MGAPAPEHPRTRRPAANRSPRSAPYRSGRCGTVRTCGAEGKQEVAARGFAVRAAAVPELCVEITEELRIDANYAPRHRAPEAASLAPTRAARRSRARATRSSGMSFGSVMIPSRRSSARLFGDIASRSSTSWTADSPMSRWYPPAPEGPAPEWALPVRNRADSAVPAGVVHHPRGVDAGCGMPSRPAQRPDVDLLRHRAPGSLAMAVIRRPGHVSNADSNGPARPIVRLNLTQRNSRSASAPRTAEPSGAVRNRPAEGVGFRNRPGQGRSRQQRCQQPGCGRDAISRFQPRRPPGMRSGVT